MEHEEDGRLKSITENPIYNNLPKRQRKVRVDSRFSGVLNDPKFTKKIYVDKRGRKVTANYGEHLKMMYEVDEQPQVMENNLKFKKKVDIRGENINLSSSELDSDEIEDEYDDLMDNTFQNDVLNRFKESIRNSTKMTLNKTSRLAVCNMDWDRIDANDIYMIFQSFLPNNGKISSVCVYISDYGKEKLLKETQEGPTDLIKMLDETQTTSVVDTNSESYIEAYREYQLQRMKYYYAVIEFDSINTADHIYNECDDMDYEHSALSLDVRFIPDNVTFDNENLKSSCYELDSNYKPLDFYMDALQQTKLKIKWDETDQKRKLLTSYKRKYTPEDIMTNSTELDNLIASPSTSDEEIGDENNFHTDINRSNLYKEILEKDSSECSDKSIEEYDTHEKDDDVEVDLTEFKMPENVKKAFQHDPSLSFKPYNSQKNKKIKGDLGNEIFDSSISHASEKAFESYDFSDKFDKGNNNSINESHKLLGLHALMKKYKISKNKAKKILKQRKLNKCEEQFELDTTDPRFSSLFTSSEYAVDPSNPHYKNSKSMDTVLRKQTNQRSFTKSTGISGDSLKNDNGLNNHSIKQDKSLVNLVEAVKSIKTKIKPKFK